MLREKLEKTIVKFRMLSRGDRVLVGVSGGPDSVCLIYLLFQIKKDWELELHIAHLNHKLREEAEADALFVKKLSENLRLPFHCEEIDVKKEIAKRGLSEEEGARLLRYEFFFRRGESLGIRKIALGHTRDDQVETVLMRLLKGAGLLGLRGIPPVREEKGFLIIRPLFEIWREEIIKYLNEEKIEYRIDKSNLSSAYLRNRIRNELIPYLIKEFNPQIKEVLANMAENLGLAYEYIHKQGKRKFKTLTKLADGKITILQDKFKALHPILQREIFRLAIGELKGNLRRINYQHWKEFTELLKRPGGSILSLPRGISVEKGNKDLIFFIKK
ncbi:MAG: tRNA lysidine(34) synthetase TilS [Candidatus Omnitrophica bacterium]|nr:tRNA lysidine(34) synthetase TilS [Candidatus Omnitrophota bacterium]MCM8792987.1 tRNA lysidine(34) synthetase TilS [Candidatus Omnitrophota bacterium]